jgi:hypothetical protein
MAMTGVLAASIALVIILIVAFDYPFRLPPRRKVFGSLREISISAPIDSGIARVSAFRGCTALP